MSEVVIDLGCGPNKKDDSVIGVDQVRLPGVDVVHDLLVIPYPFDDNFADRIIISHVLEHFTVEQQNIILAEVYRILKPGAIVEISVPHAWSSFAIWDRSHKTLFSFWSFRDYLDGYSYNTLPVPFKVTRISGSVNAFKGDTPNTPVCKKSRFYGTRLDRWMSLFLTFILRKVINRLPSCADNLAKYVPAFGISVHIRIRKVA